MAGVGLAGSPRVPSTTPHPGVRQALEARGSYPSFVCSGLTPCLSWGGGEGRLLLLSTTCCACWRPTQFAQGAGCAARSPATESEWRITTATVALFKGSVGLRGGAHATRPQGMSCPAGHAGRVVPPHRPRLWDTAVVGVLSATGSGPACRMPQSSWRCTTTNCRVTPLFAY